MKIFCTGTSGSGRHEYIMRFVEYAKDHGEDIKVFDVGKMLFQAAERSGVNVTAEKILDTSQQTLNALRAAVFEEILKESKNTKNYVVLSHGCFRWEKRLTHAMDIYYLNELLPDIYITIIDDISKVKANLDNTKQWRGKISLKELLMWREEEIFVTKLMADYQKKSFYILAKNQPPETLFKLAFRPKMEKIYLSYPITHLKDNKEHMNGKDKLYRELNRKFVVYDPLAIKDMDLLYLIEDKEPEDTVTLAPEEGEHSFSYKEISDAEEDIKSQVQSRDYNLIDQSDMIVVYYPTDLMSQGVSMEMKYSYDNNKNVYAIHPYEASPFFETLCEKIFSTPEECLEHFGITNGKE